MLQEWQVNDNGSLLQMWQVNDDKFHKNEDKICLLFMRLVSYIWDQILDHVLDYIIIGILTTGL